MERTIIDADVLVARSGKELKRLLEQRIQQGWVPSGMPKSHPAYNPLTQQEELVYSISLVRYQESAGE